MTPKDILLWRVARMEEDLSRAHSTLTSDAIPQALKDRLGTNLSDVIETQLKKIEIEREATGKLSADPSPESRAALKDAWRKGSSLQRSTDILIAEILALFQGALLRRHSAAAQELSGIADSLIAELCQLLDDIEWKRFTVTGAGEAFTERGQVIRLRFPVADIWNLPVVAHEFGHFLASRLRKSDEGTAVLPFQQLLRELTNGQVNKTWYYLNEFFADMAATYAIGPAYGYTCVLMRFNAVQAWQEIDKIHPPDGHRTFVILETLELMNRKDDSNGEFTGVIAKLKAFWLESLAAAGQPQELPSADASLKDLVSKIYTDVLKPCAPNLRYSTLARAKELDPFLKELPAAVATFAIKDLINAAWRRRLSAEADDRTVNDNFMTLWRTASAHSVAG